MRFCSFLAGVLVLTLCSLPALADVYKSDDVIRYRRAEMVVAKRYFDALRKMAGGREDFDALVVGNAVAYLEWHGRSVAGDFPPGSDQGDTSASPEIWSSGSRFAAELDRYRAATLALKAAAPVDGASLKPLIGELAKVCKSCHDDFKKS